MRKIKVIRPVISFAEESIELCKNGSFTVVLQSHYPRCSDTIPNFLFPSNFLRGEAGALFLSLFPCVPSIIATREVAFSRVHTRGQKEKKKTGMRHGFAQVTGRDFCRQPSDIFDGILLVSAPANRARARYLLRGLRENERRKRERGRGKKRRKGEREARRATRLLLCKLRRRVKVYSRSLRGHVAGPLSRWIRISRIDRRSPVALARNLSVDHVGPALSRIVSRRRVSKTSRGTVGSARGRVPSGNRCVSPSKITRDD